MFDPQLPRLFRDIFVDALSNFASPGHAIQARQLLPEFHALHHSRPSRNGFRRRCWTTTIVRHQSPPKFSNINLTATPANCLETRSRKHFDPASANFLDFVYFHGRNSVAILNRPPPGRCPCPISTHCSGISAASF